MKVTDLPNNWPNHLDNAIKYFNDCILPLVRYSPNKLPLSLVVNSHKTDSPEGIEIPTEKEVNTHLIFVEQQHLDSYAATVDHTVK